MTTIINKTKVDETFAEVDVPGKNLRIVVPDNRYAYGDNESVAQIAGELVTKHASNSDTAGKVAYEQAREQLENIDWKNERRRRAKERVMARRPKMMLNYLKDNAGVICGAEVLMSLTDPATGLTECKVHRFTMDELLKISL